MNYELITSDVVDARAGGENKTKKKIEIENIETCASTCTSIAEQK